MTPRMLRYRESLGLLPVLRHAGRARTRRRPPTVLIRGDDPPKAPERLIRGDNPPKPPERPAARSPHRQFTDADLGAVALGLSLERRYDISPVALAFGIRVLADPAVRADVADFARRIGRIQPPPARALDFEQERALRLLGAAVPAKRR